jgi:hypothetical protein
MKNQEKGLIFCSIDRQKKYTNISENIFIYNLINNLKDDNLALSNLINNKLIGIDEVIKLKLKRHLAKLSVIELYNVFINTNIHLQNEVIECNSMKSNYLYSFNYSDICFKSKTRRKIYGNLTEFNFAKKVTSSAIIFHLNGYNLSIGTGVESNCALKNDIKSFINLKSSTPKLNIISITATNIDKVSIVFKNVKENALNNFTIFINNFFHDIVNNVVSSFTRRELKNEIQVVGIKSNKSGNLIIDIPYERIAVINFIKKLGLDNFYSDSINIPRMLEAIRMYDMGEHAAFKEYTTYAVNTALKAIERKLLELDCDQRLIALQEMNNLDSLKFIVELITDDTLLEYQGALTESELLALPEKVKSY